MLLEADWRVSLEDIHSYQHVAGIPLSNKIPLSLWPNAYQQFECIPWLQTTPMIHLEQRCTQYEPLQADKRYKCTLELASQKRTSRGKWIYSQKLCFYDAKRLVGEQTIIIMQESD